MYLLTYQNLLQIYTFTGTLGLQLLSGFAYLQPGKLPSAFPMEQDSESSNSTAQFSVTLSLFCLLFCRILFVGYNIVPWEIFTFSILSVPFHCLWPSLFQTWSLLLILLGFPCALWVSHISLSALRFSVSLAFNIFIMGFLSLFVFILVGIYCASCKYRLLFFHQISGVFAIISLNIFSVPFSILCLFVTNYEHVAMLNSVRSFLGFCSFYLIFSVLQIA